MKNNRLFAGRKLSVLSSTAISACVGCGAIFVAVLAFAYVITKIDATDLMLSVMSTAALGIGAYAGGYVCGKRQRRNGLLSGVLCGVFIFLIIVILSALFSKAACDVFRKHIGVRIAAVVCYIKGQSAIENCIVLERQCDFNSAAAYLSVKRYYLALIALSCAFLALDRGELIVIFFKSADIIRESDIKAYIL